MTWREPPEGWQTFGSHAGKPVPLEFSEETGEDGLPLWERFRRPLHWRECGGCEGLGAHRRWCPVAVGERAAYWGQLSEKAEALGDAIGPNDMGAANQAWQLAGRLRTLAITARTDFDEGRGR